MDKDKYIDLLEQSAKIVGWEWEPKEQCIHLSHSAETVLGTNSYQKLTVKDLVKLTSISDREFLCSIVKSFQQTNFINRFYFSVRVGQKELYLSAQIINRRDENEQIYVSGFVQDITEIRQALKVIDDQNDQLNEISWVQSHVIRAPVATVLGLLNVWNDVDKDEDKRQIISWIEENMIKLDSIIRELSNKNSLL